MSLHTYWTNASYYRGNSLLELLLNACIAQK